ncbi:MAG: diacylglycerol kinase family lipid kinase [Candidatus Omnitrophota bacterium]|nr:diacylglycerol kinase family lipid kinase [Candidatus Omnitrophota bacterium]
MPEIIPVIINPAAGRKKRLAVLLERLILFSPEVPTLSLLSLERVRERIDSAFSEWGMNVRIILTSAPGEATEIATQLAEKGEKLVVAVGGDGTINEVVNGLAGSSAALGVIPMGTSNSFAIGLGIPLALAGAVDVIRRRKIRSIDLGKVGNRYFAMGVGMSLDTLTLESIEPHGKRWFGAAAYLKGLFVALFYAFPKLDIEADGGHSHRGCYHVVISNVGFYGGFFCVAEHARTDDGKLDVSLFKKKGVFDLMRYVLAARRGNLAKCRDVVRFQCRRLQVTSAVPVDVHLDAEICETTPCEIECIRSAVSVVAP